MANCLAKSGRTKEAQEHVQTALKIDSRNPEHLYNAAIVATIAHREGLSHHVRMLDEGVPMVF